MSSKEFTIRVPRDISTAADGSTVQNQQGQNEEEDVRLTAPKEVLIRSELIRGLIEDVADNDEEIPIQNIAAPTMRKVLEWCTEHVNDPIPAASEDLDDAKKRDIEIPEWDKKFLDLPHQELFAIIIAANFLGIRMLIDYGCKTVADQLQNKSAEEIRKHFNIQNDFTPEEEDLIRRENEWAENHPN